MGSGHRIRRRGVNVSLAKSGQGDEKEKKRQERMVGGKENKQISALV